MKQFERRIPIEEIDEGVRVLLDATPNYFSNRLFESKL